MKGALIGASLTAGFLLIAWYASITFISWYMLLCVVAIVTLAALAIHLHGRHRQEHALRREQRREIDQWMSLVNASLDNEEMRLRYMEPVKHKEETQDVSFDD